MLRNLTAQSYLFWNQQAGWLALVNHGRVRGGTHATWSKGIYFPLPYVVPQPSQWRYAHLCQQNCWHSSKQPSVMLGFLERVIRSNWRLVPHPSWAWSAHCPCSLILKSSHSTLLLHSPTICISQCVFLMMQSAPELSQTCLNTCTCH